MSEPKTCNPGTAWAPSASHNVSPNPERRLDDGDPFGVVKIPYDPGTLEQRLHEPQWDITVTGTSGLVCWGSGIQ